MNMQEKFISTLHRRVSKLRHPTGSHLELIIHPEWANTGVGYVQPEDGFEVLSRFIYCFQSTYAVFTVNRKELIVNFDGSSALDLDGVIDEILKGAC